MQNIHDNHHRYVRIPLKEECRDMQHLQQFLQGIIEQGGEGIILRNPSSLYEHGRSRAFFSNSRQPEMQKQRSLEIMVQMFGNACYQME